MKIRTKIEIHHSAVCNQCQRIYREPPDFYFTGDYEERDRSGRTKRGYSRFLVVKCNATNCSATVLVSEDDLIALLRPELSKVTK